MIIEMRAEGFSDEVVDRVQFPSRGYHANEVSDATGLDCSESEDMAKQEFREEVDINTLVRRFHLTGELPQGVRLPEYGDFIGVDSYHEAANVMAMANESFSAMPAEVRERFGNDPGAFVEFCLDRDNLEECRKMGLAPAAEIRAAEEAAAARGVAGAAAPAAEVAPSGAPSGTLPT